MTEDASDEYYRWKQGGEVDAELVARCGEACGIYALFPLYENDQEIVFASAKKNSGDIEKDQIAVDLGFYFGRDIRIVVAPEPDVASLLDEYCR